MSLFYPSIIILIAIVALVDFLLPQNAKSKIRFIVGWWSLNIETYTVSTFSAKILMLIDSLMQKLFGHKILSIRFTLVSLFLCYIGFIFSLVVFYTLSPNFNTFTVEIFSSPVAIDGGYGFPGGKIQEFTLPAGVTIYTILSSFLLPITISGVATIAATNILNRRFAAQAYLLEDNIILSIIYFVFIFALASILFVTGFYLYHEQFIRLGILEIGTMRLIPWSITSISILPKFDIFQFLQRIITDLPLSDKFLWAINVFAIDTNSGYIKFKLILEPDYSGDWNLLSPSDIPLGGARYEFSFKEVGYYSFSLIILFALWPSFLYLFAIVFFFLSKIADKLIKPLIVLLLRRFHEDSRPTLTLLTFIISLLVSLIREMTILITKL